MGLKELLVGGGAKAPAAEPFRDSIQTQLVQTVANTIIQNTSGAREADDFWSRAELR